MLDTVSGTHVYDYDKLYQVTDVNYPPEFEYLDTVFDYDPVGNRTSVVDANGTDGYTTNVLNQYTEVADANYTYDDAGNMTNDGQYEYVEACPERVKRGALPRRGEPHPTWGD